MTTYALIGAGPTSLYTFKHLLDLGGKSRSICIYEKSEYLGRGMPYNSDWCGKDALANIASFEIPPLCQTLVEWLELRSNEQLGQLGVERADISDRTFYPRDVLGAYFEDQFRQLVMKAKRKGWNIDVRCNTEVTDIEDIDSHVQVHSITLDKASTDAFDHVVIATGHEFNKHPNHSRFVSPWPVSNVKAIEPGNVGIRGSSLTAVDAVITLANTYGTFTRDAQGALHYVPDAGTDALQMTMLSRHGLIPQADFYFDYAKQPLLHFSEAVVHEAITAALQDGSKQHVLDTLFAQFKKQLHATDPHFAEKIGLDAMTLEAFCEHYYENRGGDVFANARIDLEDAQKGYAEKTIDPWRFALLRMGELFASACPFFCAEDLQRFNATLKPLFMDNYGCIPHEA